MFFLRIDYLYKGSPVQRMRGLYKSLSDVRKIVDQYRGDDFLVLSIKIERCV